MDQLFDVVIRTQAEFEALIASPTWLDAVSVCFVGDGGRLKFTRSDGQGCKIPQTVKQIQGINSAIFKAPKFNYNESTNKALVWYDTQPITNDYSIDGIAVECSGYMSSDGYGFCNCVQLTNCSSTVGGPGIKNCGFYNCVQLISCSGIIEGTANSNAFESCIRLINCKGHSSGGVSRGFTNCTQLINCTGTGVGNHMGYGFDSCSQLVNCIATGTGGDFGEGYGFSDCAYLNGCKQGDASTTAFLGGTNTKVDTATVVES